MIKRGALGATLLGTILVVQPAAAQDAQPRPVIAFGVYGGGAAFSDLQRRSVTFAAAGEDVRQFDQAISAAPAVFGGLQLAYWPVDSWGLRLSYSFTRSHFETYSLERGGVSDAADPTATPAALTMRNAAADLVFKLPIRIRRVQTYALLGAGWTTYVADGSADAGLHTAPRQRARLTGTIGAGARVPLQSNRLSLEFELANNVAAAPWSADEVRDGDAETVSATGDSKVPEVSLVNHARLSVGLRYALPLN